MAAEIEKSHGCTGSIIVWAILSEWFWNGTGAYDSAGKVQRVASRVNQDFVLEKTAANLKLVVVMALSRGEPEV